MERNTDNSDLYKIPERIEKNKIKVDRSGFYAVFFNDLLVSGRLTYKYAYATLNSLKKKTIYIGVTHMLTVKKVD